jgi:type IV pilus assembly protein PilE
MTHAGSRMSRHDGFTLIELMITVAIVAILATIAYPSYRNAVIRSNRADAQQALLQAAQNMERYFATNGANGYVGAPVTPSQSPSGSSAAPVYNIAYGPGLGNPSATAFVLRATPVAGKPNATDGFLEIDQQGVKRWDRNNSGSALEAGEDNWNR